MIFPAGETSKQISIQIVGDSSDEANENFSVDLSTPLGLIILRASASGVIMDDDGPAPSTPLISIDDVSVSEGDGGTTAATFAVTLSASSTNTVTVDYETLGGSAVSGSDFNATSGLLTFKPGQTSRPLTVFVVGDTTLELNEQFTVTLSSPSNATLGDSVGVGTIGNDDSGDPQIADVSVSGICSPTQVVAGNELTVTLTFANNGPLASVGPNATYLLPGSCTFQSITPLLGWSIDTPAVGATGSILLSKTLMLAGETAIFVIKVRVNPGTKGVINHHIEAAASTGDTDLLDNILDIPTTVLTSTFSIDDAVVVEGTGAGGVAAFNVTLSRPRDQQCSISFATSNGSAVAGKDFTGTSGTLVFAPGETSKQVTVQILGDAADEPNEDFVVNLNTPVGATVFRGSATGVISDDDGAPSVVPFVSIGNVQVSEGDAGLVNATFTVTLSAQSGSTVTVNYATGGGTAVGGSDFNAGAGTVTFNAGETSKEIVVQVIGDTTPEVDEQFTVTLSGPVNATLGDSAGIGTILNDDGASGLELEVDGGKKVVLGLDPKAVNITVTVVDGTGNPEVGAEVVFTVTGVNPMHDGVSLFTDANGQATFTYHALMAGQDVVSCVAKSGIFPDTSIQVTALLPLTSIVKLSASAKGGLAAPGAVAPHEVKSKVKIKKKKVTAKVSGKITFKDGHSGQQFQSRFIDVVITNGTQVTVFGRGTLGSSGTLLLYRYDLIGSGAPRCGMLIQSNSTSTVQGFFRFETEGNLINGKVKISASP